MCAWHRAHQEEISYFIFYKFASYEFVPPIEWLILRIARRVVLHVGRTCSTIHANVMTLLRIMQKLFIKKEFVRDTRKAEGRERGHGRRAKDCYCADAALAREILTYRKKQFSRRLLRGAVRVGGGGTEGKGTGVDTHFRGASRGRGSKAASAQSKGWHQDGNASGSTPAEATRGSAS